MVVPMNTAKQLAALPADYHLRKHMITAEAVLSPIRADLYKPAAHKFVLHPHKNLFRNYRLVVVLNIILRHSDAKNHLLTYLTETEAEKVMRDRQKTLADIIYAQMNDHFYREEINFRASKMRPFSRIETGFGGKFKSDEIYDLRANIPAGEVRSKVFSGFTKACHTLYKFDSGTERDFAIVLENDKTVLKWMRPSAKQFDIYYGPAGINRYEPDFIVETADTIYMVETKASNEIGSETVIQKAMAAEVYCHAATDWNEENGGKPWRYVLISHDEVRLNSSFDYLVNNRIEYEQIKL